MKTLTLLSLVMSLIAIVPSVQADDSTTNPITVNAPNAADFVLFSSVKVKPDSVIAFKSNVLPYAEETRLEPGCLEYRVHQSPDDPTQFETYEHWASDEARQTHLAAAHTVQFFAAVTPLFEAGYPIRTKFIELR